MEGVLLANDLCECVSKFSRTRSCKWGDAALAVEVWRVLDLVYAFSQIMKGAEEGEW